MAEKNKLNMIYLEGGRPNRWNGLQRTIRRCKINTREQEKIALFRFDCLLFFSCSQRSCFTFLRTTFFVFSFFLLHIIFVCVFALMTSIGLYGCSIHTADSHTPHTRAQKTNSADAPPHREIRTQIQQPQSSNKQIGKNREQTNSKIT